MSSWNKITNIDIGLYQTWKITTIISNECYTNIQGSYAKLIFNPKKFNLGGVRTQLLLYLPNINKIELTL